MAGEQSDLRSEKRPYEPPVLTREGGLRDVTAGGVDPVVDIAMAGTLAS